MLVRRAERIPRLFASGTNLRRHSIRRGKGWGDRGCGGSAAEIFQGRLYLSEDGHKCDSMIGRGLQGCARNVDVGTGAALLGRPSKSCEVRSYGISSTRDAPSRTTYAHAARVSPCSLGTVVAARATGKEQRPLPCRSHSRRRAKQIDRAVFRLHNVHAECVQQLALLLYNYTQNELRPTKPGFVLAAGSRLTPLVPALDSPKLSTPTVLVSAGSVIQLSSPARVSSPWGPLRRNRP